MLPKDTIKAIGEMVTRRTSVFTPLLVLNSVVLVVSFFVYWRSDNPLFFIPAALLLAYSVWRHERFATDMPWMLSSQTIQKYGMQLTMGDSKNVLSEDAVENLEPSANPDTRLLAEATQTGKIVTVVKEAKNAE